MPHEIYYEPSRTPPDRLQKIVQADTVYGFMDDYPLGLPGFDGRGYAAVDKGFGRIHADFMRTHTRHDYRSDVTQLAFVNPPRNKNG